MTIAQNSFKTGSLTEIMGQCLDPIRRGGWGYATDEDIFQMFAPERGDWDGVHGSAGSRWRVIAMRPNSVRSVQSVL